jgi:hypothetical protein
MLTIDNLLNMDLCESCDRELAAEWKFCIYCGRPRIAGKSGSTVTLPAAIRPDSLDVEKPRRRYDAPFWVGVAMGVLGLALIIYAAVQIYGSYA